MKKAEQKIAGNGVGRMNKLRKLLERAAQRLEIPADIAAELPHIEISGFSSCSLDCHRAILAYEPERIVIRVNTGAVTIEGVGLELRHMHRDRLSVTGEIHAMTFSEEG